MCGIAAIYHYHPASPALNRDELRRIRDYMSARGPDGEGEWFSQDGQVGLGHRRLSIIDLSEKGAQPMRSQNGQTIISFNGEIYNYKHLRHDLERKGCVFQSNSDTEVLIHLYEEKGEAMLGDLWGMFAFSLWDEVKRSMLLARDPYGIKPLYYAGDGRSIRAASQVKALIAGGKVSTHLEPAGITGFYLFGSVPEPYTIYQDVHAVPAGSYVWVDEKGAAAPVRYFSVAQVIAEASEQGNRIDNHDALQLVREALLDSTQHHFVADVPVGAFLSSGIDSGAIVALAKECGFDDLQTVTLGFSEFKGGHDDECPLAEEVSKYYLTSHKTRFLDVREFQMDLPRILDAMDQPSIDGINTYFVSKAASELGWKVALSGVGGDELFGGYSSFQDIPKWVRSLSIPSRIPCLGTLFQSLFSFLMPYFSSFHPKLSGFLKYGGTYPGAYLLKRGLFLPEELPQVMDGEMAREGLRRLKPVSKIAEEINGADSAYAKVASMESSFYMRNQLLRDADWAGMAHSLEIRTPLVDAHLLRKLAPVLASMGKAVSKESLAVAPQMPLPEKIRNRPKTGFTVPVNQWLQQDKNLDAWREIPSLNKPGCPWARRWSYTVLRHSQQDMLN